MDLEIFRLSYLSLSTTMVIATTCSCYGYMELHLPEVNITLYLLSGVVIRC